MCISFRECVIITLKLYRQLLPKSSTKKCISFQTHLLILSSGNNIYGKDVATLLQGIGSSVEREAYILMDRIHPPPQMGFILRPDSVGKIEPVPLIGELGVFGVYVRYAIL